MAYREGTVLKHEIAFFAQIEAEGAYTRISKGVTDMSGSLVSFVYKRWFNTSTIAFEGFKTFKSTPAMFTVIGV